MREGGRGEEGVVVMVVEVGQYCTGGVCICGGWGESCKSPSSTTHGGDD